MRRVSILASAGLLLAAAPPADGPAKARLEALNAREAAITAELGASRTQLVHLLAALEAMRRDPPPALLVSPGQARDAARAAILLHAIQPELELRARAFAARTRELNHVRRDAAEAGAALFTAESAAAERYGARGAARGEATTSEAQVKALPPARLLSPLAGAPTRRFGADWPGRGRTEGWTWSPPSGAEVRAPAGGTVEYAGALKTWKLVVILRLESGWRLVLAGLSTVAVAPGSQVAAGAVVGRMGPAPAPGEFYLELRRGSVPADPGPALAAGARAAP